MNFRRYFLFIIFFSGMLTCMVSAYAQKPLQNIRGKIRDREILSPLAFANIGVFKDSVMIKGTMSDENGNFRMDEIPVGKYTVRVTYVGYRPAMLSNIEFTSAKEVILNIELEEMVIAMKEVEVVSTRKEGSVNEMSLVSARTFTLEETERYAGSRQDPARMASNFAGVNGANDSRNDIVIRGNSPMGLLWRLDDVDIPNPNHFAVPGTTGGAVSILNNKILSTSDFMTGAFSAEYGNAMAGVFDLKTRNGNNEKHEFTGQLGFLGTELSGEGPLSKSSGASYLVTYKYSTLKLFESMKIKIGTSAVPNYQDASFKINLPSQKAGTFSVFGIGGISKIDIMVSPFDKPQEEIYGIKDRDQYFRTSMGMGGVSHTYPVNASTYTKLTLSGYVSNANSHHDLVFRDANYTLDSIVPKLDYRFITGKYSVAFSLNKKISSHHFVKAGIHADRLFYDFSDSNYVEKLFMWDNRLSHSGGTFLLQPYVSWKYKLSEKFLISTGLHAQMLELNNSFSAEPRISFRWNVKDGQAFSLGYGLHSQMLPLYIYFQHSTDNNGNRVQHNRGLGFMKAHHLVASYDYALTKSSRLKIESYYQRLFNIPVDTFPSSFSLLNQGSTFSRFFPGALVNEGTGNNYGMEFTIEKFFSRSYFMLATLSMYDSKFKGSDGIERNTDFNGKFTLNTLAGRDFALNKKGTTVFKAGLKVTWAGGRRYTPADTTASNFAGEVVEIDSLRNTLQFRDYFRTDLKVGFKINALKLTHEIAFDFVNLLNTKNILGLTYVPGLNPPLREEYQLGFLPLFYYKIDF